MKKSIGILCLIVCLVFIMGGCGSSHKSKGETQIAASEKAKETTPAATVEKPKSKSKPRVVGKGIANAGFIIYDMGAMTINTVWGIGTFGYGFVDGQTLLPLYYPQTGKFGPQRF